MRCTIAASLQMSDEPDFLRKLFVFQWSTIVCVGLRQLPLDDFTAVVDNDVQFETIAVR